MKDNGNQELDNMYDANSKENSFGTGRISNAMSNSSIPGMKNSGKYAKNALLNVGSKLLSLISLKAVLIAIAIALLFVMLVGSMAFVLLGPGSIRDMLVSEITEMFDKIYTKFKGFFIGQAEASVDHKDVVATAQYLDNMGYRLEGYGFGKVTRDKDGKVEDIDSKYLDAYFAANEKTYLIANDNFNMKDMFKNLTDTNDGTWGSGMIVLNKAFYEGPSVSVDRKNKMLEIHMDEKGKEVIYKYNLEGWMGRYGKPVEFSLALHTGTMAPDFAYEIATGSQFDTKVYIKFKKVGVTTRIYYKGKPLISYKDEKTGNQIPGWDTSVKDATNVWKSYNQRIDEYNRVSRLQNGPTMDKVDVNDKVKAKYGINQEDIDKAKEVQEAETYFIYKPYIRAVQNHWFRDLDFSKAYRVADSTPDKEAWDAPSGAVCEKSIQREGDIYQVAEPKVVGGDVPASLSKLFADDQSDKKTTGTNTGTGNSTDSTAGTNTGNGTGDTAGNDSGKGTGTSTGTVTSTTTGDIITAGTGTPIVGQNNKASNFDPDVDDLANDLIEKIKTENKNNINQQNNKAGILDNITNLLNGNNNNNNTTTGSASNTTSSGDYEGKKLDELFKKKFKIADGLSGVSEEAREIDAKKTLKYGITILENVHSADSELILRDLKLYLTKRGFQWKDQYVITDPSTIKPYEDDRTKLEYGGTPFDGSKYKFGWNGRGGLNTKPKPLGGILDGNNGGVEISDDRLTVILHHKSPNNQDGFETGATVKSPGDGKVIQAANGTIVIQFSGPKEVLDYKITISGFNIDPSIKQGSTIKKSDKIGTTGDGDITITMVDNTGKPVSPADYLPIISATDADVDLFARLICSEAGNQGIDGMAAVAWCILHRVNSSQYPNTLEGVIYQETPGNTEYPYQYDVVRTGAINQPASSDAINVARQCLAGTMSDPLEGKIPDGETLYFMGTSEFTEAEMSMSQYCYRLKDHLFFHTWGFWE